MGMKGGLIAVAMGAALFGGGTALGQDASGVCINSGNRYQVGDYACIPACHGRQRYARCDIIAERASWTYVSDVCPMALLERPAPQNLNFPAAAALMSPRAYDDIANSAIAPEIQARIVALAISAETRLASR